MSCAQCRGVDELFDDRLVKLERWKHRLLGPPRTTRRLIEAIRAEGIEGRSLLDVGGGLGAIQGAFAAAGGGRIEGVDAASAYVEAARLRAVARGYIDRATFHAGDFVELADDAQPADVVTLDRVICCYDDVRLLVERSAEKCRRLYGLVYPRDHGVMQLARGAINLGPRIRRSPYRFYVHEESLVRETVRSAGLHPHRLHRGWLWNVEVYRR